MTEPIQVVAASSGGSSKIFTVFSFLVKYFSWWFTIIIVSIIFIGALNESIKTHSPIPIFRELGSRIVAADLNIFKLTNKIVNKEYVIQADNQKILANRIKFQVMKYYIFFELFSSLWFIYLIAKIIYNIIMYITAQYSSQAVLFTFLIMWGLEIIASLLDFIFKYAGATMPTLPIISKELVFIFIPLKGILWMLFYSPTLLNNIISIHPYPLIQSPIIDSTIGGISNQTISKIGDKLVNVTTQIVISGG